MPLKLELRVMMNPSLTVSKIAERTGIILGLGEEEG